MFPEHLNLVVFEEIGEGVEFVLTVPWQDRTRQEKSGTEKLEPPHVGSYEFSCTLPLYLAARVWQAGSR